jgi:hypothetical protein
MNTDAVCTVQNSMDEIFAFAKAVVEEFAAELVSTDESKRVGGALDILIPGVTRQCMVVGPVSEADGLRYAANAVNKNNAMEKHGMIISELVADADAQPPVYGGGIQLPCGCFISFSGFPPAWDQAFCLMLADRFSLMTSFRRNSIIEQSADPLQARQYFFAAFAFMGFREIGSALK